MLGFGFAKTCKAELFVGELLLNSAVSVLGLAKVQGDRKALPLKAGRRLSSLPGARAVLTGQTDKEYQPCASSSAVRRSLIFFSTFGACFSVREVKSFFIF